MSGLFDGTPLERPVTCEGCKRPLAQCACPRSESGVVLLPKDQPARRRFGRGLARGRRDGFPRLVAAGVVVAGRIIDRTIDRRTVHSSGR